ncbi:phosphatidylglycerophosphatase A [Ehrlichia ruminantium]|uniref:Phosphatidylglycerophosphatase A n=1 Tax=Ehrlichia ruminantium TaxID=779 RepID=A0AAE6QAW4_EHRRU|nr:phosphatidylglycerophosphatase A [Ehrlichia ruminantium]QGR02281.1 phosphatidylglycerophosphatase A [Ehrlichia ruminantium]QGR03201.1 phosphatidylglycerophosphatase A [Ehrlichia ruminantium]QGR04126.1 phosphatidylglycerophosphatase A [Ehrlichia ruminantium]
MQVHTIIATWFGCGNISKAPGTIASLATILLTPAIIFNTLIGMLLLILVLIIGFITTSRYLLDYPGVIDPKEVVIDEVIGQLIAFSIPVIFFRHYNYMPETFDISYILHYLSMFTFSFIFFRAFDIVKIWPINAIERIPGTSGIILDDMLAGIMSSVCTIFIITQIGT